MKWSVIGLVVIGLVSATCVAILVASFAGRGQAVAPKEARLCLIEAVGPLEQGTVVTGDHIVVRKVPKGHEPDNSFRDPGQVIGKILIVSMSKGQAFTKACFPTEGTGLELASQLPDGMRAVSMEISDSFGLRGLLYPGSTVDILVSWRSPDYAEAVLKTLLEEVRVLAVDSRTVSSPEERDGEQPKAEKSRRMMVTILVNAEQAQQLQLAVKHGTLSLALRNPRDTATMAQSPTHLGNLLGKKKANSVSAMPPKIPTDQNNLDKDKVVVAPPEPESELRWQVTVIQGQKTEEVEFSLLK